MLDAQTLLRELYDRIDRTQAQAILDAKTQLDMDVACSRGCAACCTLLVSTFGPEAEAVADGVQNLPRATRSMVLGRLVAWCELFDRTGGRADVGSLPDILKWQARRIPCPFLDSQSYDCLVYAQRPIACRVHHAAYVPAGTPEPYTCCTIRQPVDGCFTNQDDVDHEHHTAIWQFNSDLQMYWSDRLIDLLAASGAKEVLVSMMPGMVLRIGRRKYGWRGSSLLIPLLPMERAKIAEEPHA